MYDELVKALRNNADHYGFVGENGLVQLLTNAADAIEALKANVQPVVRCRDCKHNAGKKIWLDHEETADCTNGHGYPPLDWFCGDGKRGRKANG